VNNLTTQETPARPERKRLTLAGSGMCSPIAQATGQFFKMSGPGYEIILRSEAGHTGGLLWPSSPATHGATRRLCVATSHEGGSIRRK